MPGIRPTTFAPLADFAPADSAAGSAASPSGAFAVTTVTEFRWLGRCFPAVGGGGTAVRGARLSAPETLASGSP
jgi:hypothetical protein